MAQRVGGLRRRGLDALLRVTGRVARPILMARSRSSILPGKGEAALPGLCAPATVHYDDHGVPHVRAETDADAFRAQGWCHARDRYFQMDMLRRVLSGRLSETVGERRLGEMALPPFGKEGTTVGADHLMRTLGLRRVAEETWAAADAEGRALLGAYVAGVNAAVRAMRRRRPLEHRLMRLPLEPWHPADSILVAKGMALGLSFKWRTGPVFNALAEKLGDRPGHLAGILPAQPQEGALAIARCVASGVGASLRFLPVESPMLGSNAWLVGGGRSESGKPILASDPHLEMTLPAIWYLASVRGSSFAAVGGTLPGLPGVVVGRTPTLAWGLTNAMLDDADLWLEELDDRGTHYRLDGAWRPLASETQEIKRRGAGPRLVRIRRTHRGPLVSDAFPGYEGPALSLRMALHEPTQDMGAFLGLGRARNVDEALAATAGFGAPAQNLLLADAEGRAAYRLMGLVPARAHDAHPTFPREGTRSETDWTGFLPPEDVPALDLGPDDQLVSANNPPVGPGYPHYLSYLFEPAYRAQRITGRLAGRAGLARDDMLALQRDAVNVAWSRFRRAILEPHAEAVRASRPALGALLDRVLAWEGDESAGARGAVPWHLLYHHLVRRTFEPLLGAELVRHWSTLINLVDEPLFVAFEDDDSPWAPPRVRATLLGEALDATLRDLASRGFDLDTPWGAMHTMHLRHPAGTSPALGPLFNRGPFAVGGGPFSVCSGQYMHKRPGPMVVGASYRQAVDLGAPADARMILCGGQSGHVGSPHYDDLTPLWLEGRTLPMRLEEPPAGADVLRLVPG